jgi:type I restriction enzyme S subunit
MKPTALKPCWMIVKFGDVVRQCKESVDRNDNHFERYVEGGHMDSENIHIRRWGDFGEDYVGPAFHRIFRKGQVLYGSRRTYLKKVAIADFDGITANTTLVLETKNPRVFLQELLPFLMLTDEFTEHSVRESKGSTNPYINWPDIAKFEFPLPPIEEQKRIAKILWAGDDAYNLQCSSYDNLMSTKRALLNRLTIKGIGKKATQHTRIGEIPSDWKVRTVKDVTTICQYGLSIPLHETGQYPILRMMNYDDGRIIPNDLKYVDLNAPDFDTFKVNKGDILFNRTNSADLVGKVGIFELDGEYVFASYLVRLRADISQVFPAYLNYYLNSEMGQKRLLAYATPGVSQTNISAGNLKKVLVPVPPLEEQKEIVRILNTIEENKVLLRAHVFRSKDCLFRLINSFIMQKLKCERAHV